MGSHRGLNLIIEAWPQGVQKSLEPNRCRALYKGKKQEPTSPDHQATYVPIGQPAYTGVRRTTMRIRRFLGLVGVGWPLACPR